MKFLILILSLFLYVQASYTYSLKFNTYDEAVVSYKKRVNIEKTHVYLFEKDNIFIVKYDTKSDLEFSYSFLQIFSHENFEKVLLEYNKIENKKNLYIKKFKQAYFLRLTNEDRDYTNKMLLELQDRYPDTYLSKLTRDSKVDISKPTRDSKVNLPKPTRDTKVNRSNADVMKFDTLEEAIPIYEKLVKIEKSNVYLYEENEKYIVMYDNDSSLEYTYSFLQIFSSDSFEKVLVEYRKTSKKENLYIKKFNQLYFLRLTNKDINYTNKMFLRLEKRFPHVYHSKLNRNEVIKRPTDISKSKIVFLKDKYELINADTVNEIVISANHQDKVPDLTNKYKINAKRVNRKNNIQVINDLENSMSNFGIVRGDILGLKNKAAYDLSAYNNYGILCSTTHSVLYLVSNKQIDSIFDLRYKKVSIGDVSDIAQIYLKNAAQKSGMIKDIQFKSLSIEDSIKALDKGKIDAFFLFAPKQYIYKYIKNNFYISSIPSEIRSEINMEEGLKVLKYKINERVVQTLQTPNYLISPLATLDLNIINKIEVVAKKFGCFKSMKIPKAFYGQLHPELLNIYEKLKAERAAQKLKDDAAKKAALSVANLVKNKDNLRNAVNITFTQKKEFDNYTEHIYTITNKTSKITNVNFEYIKTNFFDQSSVKPHHVIKLSSTTRKIPVDANSSKVISFKYKNTFAINIENVTVDLVFKDLRYNDRILNVPLVIGESNILNMSTNISKDSKNSGKALKVPSVKVKVKPNTLDIDYDLNQDMKYETEVLGVPLSIGESK